MLRAAWTLCAADASLQSLTGSSPECVVTSWQMQQRLPSDRVRSVLQTRDGYLWVATFNGAARFDGVRFHVFNDANTPPSATASSVASSRMLKAASGSAATPVSSPDVMIPASMR